MSNIKVQFKILVNIKFIGFLVFNFFILWICIEMIGNENVFYYNIVYLNIGYFDK